MTAKYVPHCTGEFYLVLQCKRYNKLTARLSARTPSLDAGEITIRLNVQVPEALFKTPQLEASVTIPDDCVTPPKLDAQVLDNVQEILEQQTGLAISLRMVEPLLEDGQ